MITTLPSHEFPGAYGVDQIQSIDPQLHNVFDVMPAGDTYDALLNGAKTVNLSLANYVDPRWEYDLQRIAYSSRQQRRPWTHEVTVNVDEADRVVIHRGDDHEVDPYRFRRHRIVLFAGSCVIGDQETPITGRVAKALPGWAALPGLELDRADMPALKVLAGEVPMTRTLDANFFRPNITTSFNPFANQANRERRRQKAEHLYGFPADALRALRSAHEIAGAPYVLPAPIGTRSQ